MSGSKPTGPPPGPQRGPSFPSSASSAAPSPRRKVFSHAAAALVGLLVGVLIGVVGSGGNAADAPTATQTVTATPQAAQTPPAAPASQPATSAPQQNRTPATEIPGDGVFLVGKDIQPGTYRSDGKDNTLCYWARLSDTTGELGDIIANGNAAGQAIIKIDSGDKAFQTSDCKPWRRIG
ncbi:MULTISPECIES: hypothetical protein [Streptomyces]|uniref:hypothetical protein n=1 Tax=Streptomyces TaxID=1883 RepID=UPI000A7FD00C|nr:MULTISPECIES: hypothetical protein [Streptomyces]